MSMYREGMNGKENSPADQTIQEGSQAAALLTLTRAHSVTCTLQPAACQEAVQGLSSQAWQQMSS